MLAPADPKEAAIAITLQPGRYTAITSSADTTTGTSLVEVYNITPK